MDRFDAMAMLLAVVDRGSLSAAGRAIRVPVPTLSRKITELEARIGTRLLIRTTRKLTLTDAGVTYVAAARRILEELQEAEREAAGEFTAPKGELVVTAPILFGRLHVLPLVTAFLAQFPEINVRLLLSDRNVHLVEDHVDMAVRIGRLPDSTMIATRIGAMRTVLCASPALLAAHGEPREMDDLRRLPFIAFEGPAPGGSEFLPPARLAVSTAEAAAEAAIRGVGVARLLHYQVADAVADGKLQIMLAAFEPEPTPVHLIHVARGQMPLKMRRFIDMAAPSLRQVLDRLSAAG